MRARAREERDRAVGWFGPSQPTTVSSLEFRTSDLSYTELASHLIGLAGEIRALEEELKSGTTDLRQRRLAMIAEGREVPGSDGLSQLPGWSDQIRSESIAASNYEADEANRRAGLLNRT
jgi:hypothetical protein